MNIRNRNIFLHILLLLAIFHFSQSFRFARPPYPWQNKAACNNFDGENGCRGNQTQNDDSWSKRAFQTPPRGHSLWR